MKKLIAILVIFFNINLISDTSFIDNEALKNKRTSSSNWGVNPYSSEWAKRINLPSDCPKTDSVEEKVYAVSVLSTSVMLEDPNIWLNGKYLEFINKKCNLKGFYSLNSTDRENFEKIVDSSLEKPNSAQKDFLVKSMKTEEKNSNVINFIIAFIALIVVYRILSDIKKPRNKLPKQPKKSNFWRTFYMWGIWDINNRDQDKS